MNKSIVKLIQVVNGKIISSHDLGGSKVNIKAVKNAQFIFVDPNTNAAPENISVKRVGKSLQVKLNGADAKSTEVEIQDFYTFEGAERCKLVGMAENGQYYEFISADPSVGANTEFMQTGEVSKLVLGGDAIGNLGAVVADDDDNNNAIAWMGLAAVFGTLGIAALASGHHGGNDNENSNNGSGTGGDGGGTGGDGGGTGGDGGGDGTGKPAKPNPPTVLDDSGKPINDGVPTNDNTPTFGGDGLTPGDTVIIKDGDKIIAEVPVSDDGSWSWTPETPISEGDHDITIIEVDKDGNESDPSDPINVIIDTVSPSKPNAGDVVLTDDDGQVILPGSDTVDTTPTFTGDNAEPGSKAIIKDGDKIIGEVDVDGNGHWTFTPDGEHAIDLGNHDFTVIIEDKAGNQSEPSDPIHVIIVADHIPANDLHAEITSIMDDVGKITGELHSGDITDDNKPTLNGTATPGSTVHIYIDDMDLVSVGVNSSGVWSYTPPEGLADGSHTFSVKASNGTDYSAMSDVFSLTIDTVAPIVTIDGSSHTDEFEYPVNLVSGDVTNDATPNLHGTTEPDSEVVVYYNNGDVQVELGRTVANGQGLWNLEPVTELLDGVYSFYAVATDVAGNTGTRTELFTLEVDTVAPDIPDFDIESTEQLLRSTGVYAETNLLKSGGLKADPVVKTIASNTPTISNKNGPIAEPNTKVIIYDNGVEIGRVNVDATGHWSYKPVNPYADTLHSLTTQGIDRAGNKSAISPPTTFIVDTTPPDRPTIDSVTDGDVVIVDHAATNHTKPTISGTAELNSTVTIYDNGVAIGTAVADQPIGDGKNGTWTFTPTDPLSENVEHHFTVDAKDSVNNTSSKSTEFVVVIDITPPAQPVLDSVVDMTGKKIGYVTDGMVTDASKPIMSGTAEPGSKVVILIDGVETYTTNADANGDWNYIPKTGMTDGAHVITVVAIDGAGNRSEPSTGFHIVIDTTAPNAPVFELTNQAGEVVTGDHPTNDGKLTFTGAGEEVGAVVTIKDGSTVLGTTTVGADGTWSFTLPTALADGQHNFNVTAEDIAGNTSAPATQSVAIDSTPPSKPVDVVVTDGEGNEVPPGGSTSDPTPIISGDGQEPGDKVIIKDGDEVIAEIPVNEDGSWSWTPTEDLPEGEHDFTVIVEDEAGNQSEPSDPINVIVDTIAPDQLNVDDVNITDDAGNVITDQTGDSTPTFSGEGQDAGDKVIIKDGGEVIGEVVVGEDGTWTFTPETELTDGNHEFTFVVEDPAGNVSPESAPRTVEVDTSVPPVININDVLITDDAGNVIIDATNDSTPTFSGEGQDVGNKVIIRDGETVIGEAVAGADGSWTFTPETALADGDHSFTFEAENAAGNTSGPSDPRVIDIDTVIPAALDVGDVTVTDDAGNVITDLTNDTAPTFSGEGQEAGDKVVIKDGGEVIGEVVVGEDGTWTFTPDTALADGNHDFTFVVEDPAGNVSPESAPIAFEIDSIPPAKIDAGSVVITDDAGNVIADITNDTTPTFTGEGQAAGDTVIIKDGGNVIGEAVVGEDGSWTFTPDTALADGNHDFTFEERDPAGNISEPSDARVIDIDTVVPAPLDVTDVTVTDDAGNVITDLTDDTTPTFSGGGQEAGDKVIIKDGGEVIGEVVVGEDGTWTFTPEEALADGNHDFTFVVEDPAGNVSPESDPIGFDIDSTPPAKIDADSVVITDDAGNVITDITNDTTPTFTGEGLEAGDTVTIKDGGNVIGEVVAGADGSWTFTPDTALEEGNHEFTFEARDPAGNVSEPSDVRVIDIDTSVPPAININDVLITDDAGNVIIDATNDSTPTFSGEGQDAGNKVIIRDGEAIIGEVTVGGDGSWTFTPETALADGDHSFTFEAENIAGNTSGPSDPRVIDIDTVIPAALDVGDVTVTDDAGNVITDLTNDPTPTFSGEGQEAGDKVVIKDGGEVIGEVVVGEDGSWTFTPEEALTDGNHDFTFVVEDPAGNVSPESAPIAFEIDSTAPAKIDANSVVITDDAGNVIADITNDTTPTFTGEGQAAGDTVIIKDGGNVIGEVVVGEDGSWTFTPDTALADGNHEFTFEERDPAGNVSEPSDARVVEIDTVVPVKPDMADIVITDDAGNVITDLTNDSTPTFSGEGQQPGEKVIIRDGETIIGEAVAGDDGSWTVTPTTPLTDGEHAFTAEVEDRAGNTSGRSDPVTIAIDTIAPAKPTPLVIEDSEGQVIAGGSSVNEPTPTFSGEGAETGGKVIIKDGDTVLAVVDVVNPDGSWSYTPTTPIADGDHNFTVEVQDPAGNISEPSDPVQMNIDTIAPNPVDMSGTDNGVFDDVPQHIGKLDNNAQTNDANPEIRGNAEAGTTVVIYDNGVQIGTAEVGTDGKWSFTPDAALADGPHTLSAIVVDDAGNQSTSANIISIVVDTIAPNAPVIESIFDDFGPQTGPVLSGGYTDDRAPTLSGTAAPGTIVSIYNGDQLIGSTTVIGSNGRWSFTPSSDLDYNSYSFTAKAGDVAGNTSQPSNAYSLVITDGSAQPVTAVITEVYDHVEGIVGPITNGGVTNDPRPTLSGTTTQPGGQVKIYVDDILVKTVVADAQGNWTFTLESALSEQQHTLNVQGVDLVGNAGIRSGDFSMLVDTTPPAPGSIDMIYKDNVPEGELIIELAKGDATNDTTPTLTGRAEIGCTVQIYNGQTLLDTVVVDGTGHWSYTPSAELAEGFYQFNITVVDAAGNASAHSDNYPLEIDTTPPGVPDFELDDDDMVQSTFMLKSVAGVEADVAADDSVVNHELTAEDVANLSNEPIVGTEGKLDIVSLVGHDVHLDLTMLDNSGMESVEKFDISGEGSNQLTLSINDVLHLGETDLVLDNGKTQLVIDGDADDILNVVDTAGEWNESGTAQVNNVTYHVYDNAAQNASLLVEDKVQVTLM